jgi:methionine sulfoxide reductase heme-binding subunit
LSLDEILWLTSRTAALTAFFVLAATLISGQALRTASFDGIIRSRDLSSLHRFLTVCWVPFVAIHVLAMLLDPVARIGPFDVVVPFRVSYSSLSIGLGTLGFDLLLVVVATSYLKRQLDAAAWRWLHRLSYVMFGVFVAHALLSGTDFTRPVVLAAAAAVVAFIAIMTAARVIFGRLESVAR